MIEQVEKDQGTPELRPPSMPRQGVALEPGNSSHLQRTVWLLLGVVITLALLVLLVLPYMAADLTEDGQSSHTAATDSQQPPPLPVGVARYDAEQALQDYLRLRAHPDLANVERWGAADWQQARGSAAAGDEFYGRGQFMDAQSAYQEAARGLERLQGQRMQRLADSLQRGWDSLQRNELGQAAAAFQQALAIEAANEQAVQGLNQVNVRPEVLQLMAEARQAEELAQLSKAVDIYRAVLQRDAAYNEAKAALEKASGRLAEQTFRQAMSDALIALDKGALAAATDALETAAQIYPDAAAVKDARRRLAESMHQSRLKNLRRQAEQAAQKEDWKAVTEIYRRALALDERAIFASSGLAQSTQRRQLHAQLDHYLADTTRLYSDEPLANARRLLAVNRKIPGDEPRLAQKLEQLQRAVRLAARPVTLNLKSDNQTEISIYHVGRVGRLLVKQITLRPGRYTVVGSCPGYRDVRRDILLTPETAEQTLSIRCEEAI